MPDLLVFALLFAALVIGFSLGYYQCQRGQREKRSKGSGLPRKRYYQGLAYLLNDQPDAAIDTFISSLEVNSDTLETHLALGNLLRKRGEVARAIRVHQNLIARPSLSKPQLHFAQLELGVDYLKSGLLDRAEALFKELADGRDTTKDVRDQALAYLIEVFQDLREWLKAIDAADRLTTRKFASSADRWREIQAQFCCELANESVAKNDLQNARRLIRNALKYDKNCVRANLLQAKIEMDDGAAAVALVLLRKIPKQNERFVSESLPLVYECYEQLDSPAQRLEHLRGLYHNKPSLVVLEYLAEATEVEEGAAAAYSLLKQELQSFSSLQAIADLLELLAPTVDSSARFQDLKPIIQRIANANHHYQCNNCGFVGEHIHWLCPRCKTWASISRG
jgi:Predicted N-acetylglucosaminyl transferase